MPVPLGGRAFEIVEVLATASGATVTKADLMERIWPGAVVGDNTLQVHVSAIRKALGADRELLKTVSGRGYRLLGKWPLLHARAVTESLANAAASLQPGPLSVRPLPVAGADLIGRAADVRQVRELLSAYRAVTLTGPGGIGKTRLALEVARGLCRAGESDGALVELASLSDPGLVASTVASALGIPMGDEADPSAAIGRAIGDRALLLALDNCEHVIEAAARLVETVLRLCPRTTVLATSRELLRIDGEYAFQVRPLEVPTKEQSAADEVLGYSAVQLFIARATAVGGAGVVALPHSLADVVTICKRLDGIPLAIELAAARAATLGLSEVVLRLDDRFTLLTSGRRTALPRHRTLRAALDWSYGLLSPREQQFFRALGIFAAGFTVEGAAAVADASRQAAVDDIASLAEKSLIYLDRPIAPARWRLLETTRAYAAEALRQHGEFDAAARRLAECYVGLLKSLGGGQFFKPTAERTNPHLLYIDNLRAALDWSFSPRGDVAIGVTLTILAIPLWLGTSRLLECGERIERALNSLAPDSQQEPRARLQLYAALSASLLFTAGLQRETGMALNRMLAVATDLDDVDYQLQALWALWSCHRNNGKNYAEEPVARQFIQIASRAANPSDVFVGERLMGVTMHYRGQQKEARRCLENFLMHYVSPADQRDLLRFHNDQGILARAMYARVLWVQGLADQALEHARASVADAEASGHALSLCYALAEAAGPIAHMTGHREEAERYVARLIGLAADRRVELWETWGRCIEGTISIESGDPMLGVGILRKALDTFRAAGWAMRFPGFLGVLATGLAKAGQLADGMAAIDEALARAEQDGEKWCFAELLRIKADIMLRTGTPTAVRAAAEALHAAIDCARRQDAPFWELRAAIDLARLQHEEPGGGQARAALADIYRRFTEGFDTPDLIAAGALLGRGDPQTHLAPQALWPIRGPGRPGATATSASPERSATCQPPS